MKKLAIYISALLTTALTGCLVNDFPYPVVECRVESISVEGLAGEPVIDHSSGTVTLPLLETTDIQNVKITDVTITENAVSSRSIVGTHNLSIPFSFVLSMYANYEWRIVAEQTIPRYFTVEGQVGATEWNLASRTAKVYVGYRGEGSFDPSKRPSAVKVTSLKLGPEGITNMRIPAEQIEDFDRRDPDRLWDFTTYRRVEVSCHGRTEEWNLYVEYTDMKIDFRRADGWVRTAWFYGEGLSGTELGFRYREAGSERWTTVPSGDIVMEGGSFRAQVKGLQPDCDYEAVAYSDDDDSAIVTFRTEPELPLPNSDFETWSQQGNVVCPYASTDGRFWDTGNWGSTTLGADYNITTFITNDIHAGSPGRTAVRMASRYVVIKFAAGNIFTGEYASTVGADGVIHFGRPFTSHPTALRGWVKFSNGKINRLKGSPQDRKLTTDDYDEGMIYVALGTWTPDKYGYCKDEKANRYPGTDESPVMVYSADESTFFNRNAPDVIGYGEKVYTRPTDGWEEFRIDIDYKSTDVAPTHIIIVCSASRWGDYFTGCDQNVMLIDDFELLWE